jgi:hypothetical protein
MWGIQYIIYRAGFMLDDLAKYKLMLNILNLFKVG